MMLTRSTIQPGPHSTRGCCVASASVWARCLDCCVQLARPFSRPSLPPAQTSPGLLARRWPLATLAATATAAAQLQPPAGGEPGPGCALAMQRLPEATEALLSRPDLFDMCCHGYRWEDHCVMEREQEREQIRKAIALMEEISGERPVGWCKCSRSLCVFLRSLKDAAAQLAAGSRPISNATRTCRWTTSARSPPRPTPTAT